MPETISVIASSYNQLAPLKLFLRSLYAQVVLPLEILVADDGSTDGTLEWLETQKEQFPTSLSWVTRNHNGYRLASLQNLGAKQATGNRLLFTNADVVHCPTSVKSHAGLSSNQIGAGVIKSISAQGTALVMMELLADFRQFLEVANRFPAKRSNAVFIKQDPNLNPLPVWGGNFSIPKEVFVKAGGFDEAYLGWGGEDTDLVVRCRSRFGYLAAWAVESVGYHLDHPQQDYHRKQLGTARYLQTRR